VGQNESQLDPITEKMFERLGDHTSRPEEFTDLITQGANIYQQVQIEYEERAPVVEASRHPNIEVLRLFLSAGAHSQIRSDDTFRIFLYAATTDHISLLFKSGLTYPPPTEYGETPLRCAYHDLDLGRVSCYLSHGAAVEEMECSPIHLALLFERDNLADTIAKYRSHLELKDRWSRTPLLLAAQLGDTHSVKLLVASGANLKAKDHVGQLAIHFSATNPTDELLHYLIEIGFKGTERDDFKVSPLGEAVAKNREATTGFLIALLQTHPKFYDFLDEALNLASSPELASKLIELGANPDALDSEMREKMNPSAALPLFMTRVLIEEFTSARKPRFGRSNPEECNEPFWQGMIVNRYSAYRAIKHFGVGRSSYEPRVDPVWCADRFGQSLTRLPDGRVIEIAGEHEDGYDPDFCIYNDVFVHEPGQAPRIFLYPKEVFPPTDFHSATLVGDWIYIIGSLGYIEDRKKDTCPVFRLNIHSLEIESVRTSGADPGRIHRHRARLFESTRILICDGKRCSDGVAFGSSHPPVIFDTNSKSWMPTA
jgi:hypothetical protein